MKDNSWVDKVKPHIEGQAYIVGEPDEEVCSNCGQPTIVDQERVCGTLDCEKDDQE